MKNRFWILLLLFFCVLGAVFAQVPQNFKTFPSAESLKVSASPLVQRDMSCGCHAEDPLEIPSKFNFGVFSGLCIDACRFRPARLLFWEGSTQRIEVGNILHEGFFYKSAFSLNQIEQVDVGFEMFAPGVYHVFLKFTLQSKPKKPIYRLPQLSNARGLPAASSSLSELKTLILSSEGIPPKDQGFNLIKSYFENYVLGYRLLTGEEFERWTRQQNHPVKFYKLNMSSESARRVFLSSMRRSEERGLESVYKLFSNNCSTSVLSLIDTEIQMPNSLHHTPSTLLAPIFKLEEALPIIGPIGTLRALESRQLIKK